MKAVFFDLDGTLLHMDEKLFMKLYFPELYKGVFKKAEIPFDAFLDGMYKCLKLTALDEPQGMLNFDKFNYHFQKMYPIFSVEEYAKRIVDFYTSERFDVAKIATHPQPSLIEAVKYLKEKGYEVAIATNPFFPEIATLKRVEWAGLNKDDFEFISVAHNSHYLKPSLEFYQECLNRIPSLKAEETLMVGNDVDEDLISSKLGLKTYLITDCYSSKGKNDDLIKLSGSAEEFLQYVKENF